jgi:predicted nuclease of restriction endonuclease-like RecB superfamily
MLPSSLLMLRRRGEEIVPRRLPVDRRHLASAGELIELFGRGLGSPRSELDDQLQALEGEETDYRIKRGLAHLLLNLCSFEVRAPIDPAELRLRAFALAATRSPGDASTAAVRLELANALSGELGREVGVAELERGLYADLKEQQILDAFEAPTPEALLHRYNLSQAQGVLYRASEIVLTAYRNDPGEYKLLFRYLKLFGLMAYLEGDPDHGFTITVDGPASLFGRSSRYGLDLAKFLPALLHVSRWRLDATLEPRRGDGGGPLRYSLDHDCGLVSHYKKGQPFDSAVEEAFVARWARAKTEWRLEHEVEPLQAGGSVMIPDFRLVHPDGRSYLLEIVGYWRPEYLRRKFYQVERSGREDLILVVSERLNLERAGVRIDRVPNRVVWYKGRVDPNEVLKAIGEGA